MALATYRQKRKFAKTPEPRGGRSSRADQALRFVVQKHDASRLHYDFRLELDGVLKSWAVPKGPSLNPLDKRLAVMVEDHPLEYRTFEGTIPAGNYGAGTVMVWDEGTYRSADTDDRKKEEQLLRDGLKKGRLSILLDGTKLQGAFTLLKLKRGEENAWLLVKQRDEFATDADVTEQDRSAVSGRNLAGIGGEKSKGKMPQRIRPMLATLVEKPFDRAGWLFEPKWDGYRAIAYVTRKGATLLSRNQVSLDNRFAPIVASLKKMGREAVLDGEIVVVDKEGRSQFHLLQSWGKKGEGTLCYYVFDLLHLDGRDLRALPLTRRKEMLKELLGGSPDILLSEHVEEQGVAFYQAAADAGLEGIVAKDGGSPYREGVRSQSWLKIKLRRRQEAVIGGFTAPRGSRKDIGALILGVHEGNGLAYIGHSAGRLDTAGLADLRTRLEPLIQAECPFRDKPKTNAPARWVKPKLVCEVSFQEWTQDGHLRQPIFLGLRDDKPAKKVVREMSQPVEKLKPKPRPKRPKPSANGDSPTLTNLGKVYWPEEGYTKGDAIAYYREMASVILPYLRDRPQSMHRHPNGIAGKSFYQKDVSRQPLPTFVQTTTIRLQGEARNVVAPLCQDEASLLYLANLGCIELNPWHARVGSLDNPDYLAIDLDPVEIAFDQVVEAAVAVRRVLDKAGAECVCKTSGKRGLHIYVPLGAKYDSDHARQFAELVAALVHQKLPATTSLERSPSRRQGRVYLDWLQNRHGQTLACAYSLRPAPGATVSTPLRWREIKKGLDPAAFTLRTTARRVAKVGDLWEPVLGPGIDLEACLQRLSPE